MNSFLNKYLNSIDDPAYPKASIIHAEEIEKYAEQIESVDTFNPSPT